MAFPSETAIRAARRWLSLLSTSDVGRARALLTGLREYADLTPTQYDAGYVLLDECGLIDSDGRADPSADMPEVLFERIVQLARPTWLQDADLLVREPDELPLDAARLGASLGLTEGAAAMLVRHLSGKVDLEARRRVGDAGERRLAETLVSDTDAVVDHVALVTDAYGFDLRVYWGSIDLHIEVKSTTRKNRLSIYLSRNEYETMLTDSEWILVLVVLDAELDIDRILSVSKESLSRAVPRDALFGRWESVRIEIGTSDCIRGIPALYGAVRNVSSLILVGAQAPTESF